ncbi:PEP-CTERM sorting domain-containing protein [bacterium]|nr:MAG: PEP-CTERM sorting domain-containing protein [bacterium]
MQHFSRFTVLLALSALAAGASAVTLSFDDIVMPEGSFGTPFTVSAPSALGPLEQNATLSFTLTTEGGAWISDLELSVTDPGGTNVIGTLPGAPNDPGDYSGTVSFFSAMPSSGTYELTFTNAYETAFQVTLSNIKLDVSPQAVPEPASMAALGLGAAAVLRRRRTKA